MKIHDFLCFSSYPQKHVTGHKMVYVALHSQDSTDRNEIAGFA